MIRISSPIKISVLIVIGAALWAFGRTLTETDAVALACKNNPQFKSLQFDRLSDSLDLVAAKATFLPSVDLSAGIKALRTDAPLFVPDSLYQNIPLSAALKQTIVGGGSVTASLNETINHAQAADTLTYATASTISISQPLLKQAGAYGAADQTVRMQTIAHREFTLSQRKQLLALLSTTRKTFWDLFEKSVRFTVTLDVLNYKRQQLNYARSRFAVGQTAELDTLSSALELLKSRSDSLSAVSTLLSAHNAAARFFVLPPESLSVDTAMPVALHELPDLDRFLAAIDSLSPDIVLFDVLRTRLTETSGRLTNNALPDVRLGAAYTAGQNSTKPFGDNFSYKGNGVVSLIVNYSIPQIQNDIDQKKNRYALEKNELSRIDKRRQLVDQVNELRLRWQQELVKISIQQAALAIALRNLTVAQRQFELGVIDRLTLTKATNDYADQANTCLSAFISQKRLEIEIDEITGESLNRFGVRIP